MTPGGRVTFALASAPHLAPLSPARGRYPRAGGKPAGARPPRCGRPRTASRRPRLIYPPGTVSMAPRPSSVPFLAQSRAAGADRARPVGTPGGGRASSPSPPARAAAPPILPPGLLCSPSRTPVCGPRDPEPGPQAQRSPRPARGGGGARRRQSCFARAELAAETAASRPLPALGGSEHTHTRHHPLPAGAPLAAARTRQHPLPVPMRSPGCQRCRAGGGRTSPPRAAKGTGRGG